MLASLSAAAAAAPPRDHDVRSGRRPSICGRCPEAARAREASLALAAARVAVLPQRAALPTFLEAQEAERRRIARDLHDVVGQALAAARMGLTSAQGNLVRDVEAAREAAPIAAIAEAIAAVDEALRSVRAFAIELRPAVLDDLGLVAALRWAVARTTSDAGLAASLDVRAADFGIDKDVETACFRLVQEALLNVARHAGASCVTVSVTVEGSKLEVIVRDDGQGFDPGEVEARTRSGKHLGLVGMHERAEAVGGCVEVRSVPGIGSEVLARFPVRVDALIESVR